MQEETSSPSSPLPGDPVLLGKLASYWSSTKRVYLSACPHTPKPASPPHMQASRVRAFDR